MVNRDLGKKENVESLDEDEKIPTQRVTLSDLPASAVVVHSSETDDAPQKEVHEAYSDDNIERLKENASPSAEGESLNRDANRVKRDGSSTDGEIADESSVA